MNKIFRKCRDFGIMVRLNEISLDQSLSCVRSLKKANLPLCVINIKNSNWEKQLKEIAFKEDLFIAVEGVTNIEQVYVAAANGAQFYILESFNFKFMKELKNLGFFFIPNISTPEELLLVTELKLECVITENTNLLKHSSIVNVLNNSNIENLVIKEPNIFTIINLPNNCKDYELWANDIIKKFLNLNYTIITVKKDLTEEHQEFVNMFESTNKCKVIQGNENTFTLECSDFIRTINYFKWKNIFIDPNNTESMNGKIIKGILDRKLNGFTIILKEKI